MDDTSVGIRDGNTEEPSNASQGSEIVDWRTLAVPTSAALLGITAGASQLIGWIDVTIRAAILSALLAALFAIMAPPYIARQYQEAHGSSPPRRMIRILTAIAATMLVLCVATPVAVFIVQAKAAESEGRAHYDEQLYARALPRLRQASELYRRVGLDGWALPVDIRMIQTLAELGRSGDAAAKADELAGGSHSEHEMGLIAAAEANVAVMFGDFERAQTLYQQARQLVESQSADQATVLLDEASLILMRGSIREQKALENLDTAEAIYAEKDDLLGCAYVMAVAATTRPTPAERRVVLEAAFDIASGQGDRGLMAELEAEIARSYANEGSVAQAATHYEIALSSYEDLADPFGQAQVYSNLAVLEARSGDMAIARAHLRDAEALFTNLDLDGNDGPPRRLAQLYGLAGAVAELMGERDLAEHRYQSALSILKHHPDPLLTVDLLINYGGFHATGGNADVAERQFDEAESLLRRLVDIAANARYATLLVNRAALAARRGDVDSALRHSGNSIAVADASGDKVVLSEACTKYRLIARLASTQTLEQAAPCDAEMPPEPTVDDLLIEYNLSNDSVRLARALLDTVADPSLSSTDELRILSMIVPTDLIELDEAIPVAARLRELLANPELTQEQQALAHGQLARIADVQNNPDRVLEHAQTALSLTESFGRLEHAGWRLQFGFILAMNGAPLEGLDQMWRGYHDGQATVFELQPALEWMYALQLQQVIEGNIVKVSIEEQQQHVERALANAESEDARLVLEALQGYLSD